MDAVNPNEIGRVLSHIDAAGVFSALTILVLTWLVARLVRTMLARLGERWLDRRLMLQQVSTLTQFAIYLFGIATAFFASFHLSEQTLLAITGTLAVTLGFALKDLASSVIAGLIIIIDRPFLVGDRVTFGDVYGEITSIGLRSVRLVTLDDNVVTIPNNKFLSDVVASGNWGALDMLVQIDFLIDPDNDLAVARKIVTDCLVSSRFVYTNKPWTVLVSQVAMPEYVAVRLRAKAYVLDIKFEKAFETDVSQRALQQFREQGVRMPGRIHAAA